MATSQGQEWSMDQSSEQGLEVLIAASGAPPRPVPKVANYSPTISVTCGICTSEVGRSEATVLTLCNHCCCNQCLTDYLTLKISERTVKLCCPYYNCKTKVAGSLIRRMVEENVYAKWCRFEKIEFLEKDVRLRWCPRPDCEGFDYGDENKRTLTCQVCSFAYCYLCNKEWHGSVLCEEEKMPRGVKFCPRCSIKVEKVPDTCDFMRCKRCEFAWCWLCGKHYSFFHDVRCKASDSSIYRPDCAIITFVCTMPIVMICFLSASIFLFFFTRLLCASRSFKVRVCFIVITSILSVLLTLPSLILLVLFSGVFVLCSTEIHNRDGRLNRLTAHEKRRLVCSFLLGVLISPLIDVMVLLYIPLGPVLGLVLLVWKVARTRWKVQPVLVKNAIPGYRVGK